MFVKDIMTKNPIAIELNHSVAKAYKIMNENGFSQLPVVDENNTLVGLITESALEEVSPSSNLNDFERNFLLSKTKLRDIMKTGFYVMRGETIIESAALSIKENRISSIFVIDDNNHLCGIITKTDVFKALINIMNIKNLGTRLYLKADKSKNVYKELSDFFADENINIINFCATTGGDSTEISIKLEKSNISSVLPKIEEMGYEIIKINVRN